MRDRMRIICLGAKSCRLTQDPFLMLSMTLGHPSKLEVWND